MKMNRDALVAGGVAGAAFIASAQHIWHVTVDAGNPGLIAALHPAAIDGLIYIGIRAVQRGQRRSGTFALFYGAAYSLAFNAASYGGFRMHWIALAACLPIALVAAVLIVHGSHAPVAAEPEVVRVARELLPIVPLVHAVTPRPSAVRVPRQRAVHPVSGGPAIGWDLDKVVDMLQRGEADAAIMSASGVSAKGLQRARRAVRAVAGGQTDVDIIKGDLTAAFVAKVRKAMEVA